MSGKKRIQPSQIVHYDDPLPVSPSFDDPTMQFDDMRGMEDPEITKARLSFMTYESRQVVDTLRRFDDLNLFWQVVLMQEVCRLGPEFVIQSLTPGPKDVKMDWAHSNLRRLLQSRSTYLAQFGHAKEGKEPKSGGKVKAKNETRDVTFRKREMWLLHRIDQVLATDYYTRLVPLSDFLCRISMSSLEDLLDEMVMGGGRVQMQFVFAALERHVAKDKDTSDFSDRLEPHKIEPLKHSTEAGLEALRRGIEDLETLPKKEDPW